MAYTALSLGDIKVLLRDRFDVPRFWVEEEFRLAFNEALRDWNLFTGKWRRRGIYNTVANQTEYLLGSTLTYAAAVKVGGRPLLPSSMADLELGRPNWRTETVASGGDVPTVPTVWAPLSLQQIVLWPAVTVGVANALAVDGVSNTPVLVEDADTVDLGEEHIDILADYAAHIAVFKQGGPQWKATLPFYRAFLQAAAEENGRLKANQKFRRAAGLDRRRDLLPSKGIPTQIDAIAEQVK